MSKSDVNNSIKVRKVSSWSGSSVVMGLYTSNEELIGIFACVVCFLFNFCLEHVEMR